MDGKWRQLTIIWKRSSCFFCSAAGLPREFYECCIALSSITFVQYFNLYFLNNRLCSFSLFCFHWFSYRAMISVDLFFDLWCAKTPKMMVLSPYYFYAFFKNFNFFFQINIILIFFQLKRNYSHSFKHIHLWIPLNDRKLGIALPFF